MGRLQSSLLRTLSPLLLTLCLVACTYLPLSSVPSPLPTATSTLPDLQAPIQHAVAYLQNEYNPAIGLIRESPVTAPDRYWLATDNWLAALALRPYNRDLADTLVATIEDYGGAAHGLIEALAGESIAWPPHVERQVQVSPKGICVERRDRGARYTDWAEYSDLALYSALNAHNQGRKEEAQERYRQALAQFDGVGFADKAWQADKGRYATYKLALALHVGLQIGEAPTGEILPALLSKQTLTGGFTALYDTTGNPVGDTNTETTAYALLALQQLANAP